MSGRSRRAHLHLFFSEEVRRSCAHVEIHDSNNRVCVNYGTARRQREGVLRKREAPTVSVNLNLSTRFTSATKPGRSHGGLEATMRRIGPSCQKFGIDAQPLFAPWLANDVGRGLTKLPRLGRSAPSVGFLLHLPFWVGQTTSRQGLTRDWRKGLVQSD